MLYSYTRVLDPVTGVCPDSEHIMKSINKCWGEHLDLIVQYKGAIVPNIGHRNGRRTVTGVDKRGGKRVKKKWIGGRKMHPHAQIIWDETRRLCLL